MEGRDGRILSCLVRWTGAAFRSETLLNLLLAASNVVRRRVLVEEAGDVEVSSV